jgi:hypothetical protein
MKKKKLSKKVLKEIKRIQKEREKLDKEFNDIIEDWYIPDDEVKPFNEVNGEAW